MCEVLDRIEAKGKAAGKLETLIDLVKDGLLTVEIAAQKAGMTVEEFQKIIDQE